MKFIIVLFALAAVCLADDVETVKSTYTQAENSYDFGYELSDKQAREEHGELKQIPNDEPGHSARGSYSFVADDGQTYTVNYVADENGFQPQGKLMIF